MPTREERTVQKHKAVLEDVIMVCNRPDFPAAEKWIHIVELVAHLCLWEIEQEESND